MYTCDANRTEVTSMAVKNGTTGNDKITGTASNDTLREFTYSTDYTNNTLFFGDTVFAVVPALGNFFLETYINIV